MNPLEILVWSSILAGTLCLIASAVLDVAGYGKWANDLRYLAVGLAIMAGVALGLELWRHV